MKANLILDFDSTFVRVEALDELARIALEGAPDRDARVAAIAELTTLAMTGKLGFGEALTQRLKLFSPKRKDIDRLIVQLHSSVTTSLLAYRDFFLDNAGQIYVVSSGFREYIMPVVQEFGIAPEHVLANEFLYDAVGTARGCDPDVALAHDGGKVKVLRELALQKPVVMVGDGYTDLQARLEAAADYFIAFVENVDRPEVSQGADFVARDFGAVVMRLEILESQPVMG